MQRTRTSAMGALGFALFFGAAAAMLAGCPGTLTDEEKKMFQGGGQCPDVPTFLAQKCGTAGCHAAMNSSAGLDLASPNVEGRLVSKAGSPNCKGEVLANPIDAAGSLIYAKLTDTPPCGLKMPIGGSLSAQEIACVKGWIEGLEPTAGGGGMDGGMGGGGGAGGADAAP